ncbi:MAG: hypothetical protein B6244_10860 [Candidatus Cloacimonetes bacterium 4572_55]|nr:MAG: hypothetical protein B6244_10860 [Candidatus Cloacimonetes bacterium 4572_55]
MKEYVRLLPYLRSLWLKIWMGFFLILLGSLFDGASVTMLYPVIDKVFTAPVAEEPNSRGIKPIFSEASHRTGLFIRDARYAAGQDNQFEKIREIANTHWLEFMRQFSRKDVLLFLCVIAVVIVLAKNVINLAQSIIFIDVGQRMIEEIRNSLYRCLQKFSLSFFSARRSGDLISRLINDVEVVNAFSVTNIVKLFRDFSNVVIFLIIAFIVSVRLSLVVFIFFPPVFLLVAKIVNAIKEYSRHSQRKIADLTFIIQETLSSIRIVKGFAMEDYEIQRFEKDNKHYRKELTWMKFYGALIRPLSDTISMAVGVSLLWYGGGAIIDAESPITAGQFFVFLGALFSTMKPIKSIGRTIGELKRGTAAVERLLEIFDAPLDISESPDAIELKVVNKIIRFDRVSFSYNPETEVLKDISFTAKQGQITALVGPSGAGKTTLVDIIPRFYDVTQGAISIDGTDIRRVTLKSLRRLMGIVSQDTILFNDTVFNNIAYGVKDIDPEKVYDASRAANAHNFVTKFPQSYQTMIGERGVNLSGGQRQRLAIARALLKNPPILIFDEATSALDSESEYLVQEAIDRLMENRTVFVIAHRLSTIRHADLILVIQDGRIAERGNHEELMARQGLYCKLTKMQTHS